MKFKERHPTIEAVQFDGSQACIQDFEPLLMGVYRGYTLESINGKPDKLTLYTESLRYELCRFDWLVDDGVGVKVMLNEQFKAKYQPA